MSIADTHEDSLGTWEVDSKNDKFIRKDAEGQINGEAPFDWVAADVQPQADWFKEKLAELQA